MFTFAIAYLSIPVFIIFFSFLSMPFVPIIAIALIVLVFCLCRSRYIERGEDFSFQMLVHYWPLLLISLVVTYICVVSPFKVWDWEKHFAVLNTLVESSWPPVVKLNEQTWFLRYYLGWYVVPALLAKMFGAQLLTAFMFIWTATGVFTTLFLAFSHFRKTHHFFIATTVFFLFSGLDIIGAWLNDYTPLTWPNWPQIWVGWGEIWPAFTGISWSPQHVLGGWIGACLFLYHRNSAVKYGAVMIGIIAMWSPFCAIGLVPIAAWATLKEGYKTAITLQNLLTAPLIAIFVVLYLTQKAGQVPFMFVWDHSEFSVPFFVLFCITEFLLVLGILYWISRARRELIVTLGVFLLLLCLFVGGEVNDLLTRGSMPSFCIMSILAVNALFKSKGWSREILISYLLIGAFPVMVAFAKGLSMERVDKKMNFKKLTRLYTYKEHPYMTYSYLVKTGNMVNFFDEPLLRGIIE